MNPLHHPPKNHIAKVKCIKQFSKIIKLHPLSEHSICYFATYQAPKIRFCSILIYATAIKHSITQHTFHKYVKRMHLLKLLVKAQTHCFASKA